MHPEVFCQSEQKNRYSSKQLAQQILDKLLKKKNRQEKGMYKCHACDGWHLTSCG